MSRKSAINVKDNRASLVYATWIRMVVDLIAPKDLWLILGRASQKTSDVLAERFIDVCYDMPGAYFAIVSDTYVNAKKNIVDALFEGLERKGWIRGIHYVIDEAPPAHFAKPYKNPQQYKHTISIFNGCFVNLISMDQASGAAGNSYQHIFGDETKYLPFDKIKKLTPALRGYLKFANSVYYRGKTFTTDMPNISEGEHDWILDRATEMDSERCELALQIGLVLNELRIEKMNEERAGNALKVKNLTKSIERWEKRWVKARKGLTFFKVLSSYVNADFLNVDWYKDILDDLGIEEYKTSIGGFPNKLKKGERFYVNLGEHHFYNDGINTDFYKNYSLDEEWKESSQAQKYIFHSKPIDMGVDFGNMCSMVTGQENNNTVYLFKEFFTVPPHGIRDLANKFLEFYKDHKTKKINLYYDRSGNSYEQIGRDMATELKGYLEYNIDGTKTGWTVTLMSKGQATIYQQEEYNLMKNIMLGNNSKLPRLKICVFGCKHLKVSMENAKTLEHIDKKGKKSIHKDKGSERSKDIKKLIASTNLSDAAKYFFFRSDWVKASSGIKVSTASMAPEIIEE